MEASLIITANRMLTHSGNQVYILSVLLATAFMKHRQARESSRDRFSVRHRASLEVDRSKLD